MELSVEQQLFQFLIKFTWWVLLFAAWYLDAWDMGKEKPPSKPAEDGFIATDRAVIEEVKLGNSQKHQYP